MLINAKLYLLSTDKTRFNKLHKNIGLLTIGKLANKAIKPIDKTRINIF